MTRETEKRPFLRGRSLTSLLTLFFFLALAFSGLVLFAEPHGRVAYWTHWRFLGLGKVQWDGIHVIAGLGMIVTGIIHTLLNIKPIVRYFGRRAGQSFRPTRELFVSFALFVVLVVGAAAEVPPVQYVLDLNESIKSSWMKTPSDKPPFGHAEMHSLRSLCRKEGLDLERALGDIRAAGFTVEDPAATLDELATLNGTNPAAIFGTIAEYRVKAAEKMKRKKERMQKQKQKQKQTEAQRGSAG